MEHCHHNHDHGPTCHTRKKFDWLLVISFSLVALAYITHSFFTPLIQDYPDILLFTGSIHALIERIWIGVLLAIILVGILGKIPRDFIVSILGKGGSITGIFRATIAGVLLDLCSHGILLVGIKLYERGASAGQTMAFLISSPWNSFSLTVMLITLIGWKWTFMFIIFSMAIAILTGIIFELLVKRGILPGNSNKTEIPANFNLSAEAKKRFKETKFNLPFFSGMAKDGLIESFMVLRWVFFGIVLSALIRTFVSEGIMQNYFGPTLMGLALTLAVATIMEVCSEGSMPIADDLLHRGGAPGNAFTFLMAGVATDYTEIMALREVTRSWKIALFLPLLTVPQVLLLGWIINSF